MLLSVLVAAVTFTVFPEAFDKVQQELDSETVQAIYCGSDLTEKEQRKVEELGAIIGNSREDGEQVTAGQCRENNLIVKRDTCLVPALARELLQLTATYGVLSNMMDLSQLSYVKVVSYVVVSAYAANTIGRGIHRWFASSGITTTCPVHPSTRSTRSARSN